MRTVTVVYHCESGTWWADSPDTGLETFVAGGGTLDETRKLATEGLEFHLSEAVTLDEYFNPANTITHLEVDADEGVFSGFSTEPRERVTVTFAGASPCPIAS
jgi:predicted RNase H-like HicB family nuclease